MKVKEFLRDPRGRVIIATIATSAILLILVVMLIINLVNCGTKSQVASEHNDVAISNPVEVIDDTLAAEDKNADPVDNSNDAGIVVIPSDPDTTVAGDLPKTGPESILPLALLAGTVTVFLLSRKQQSLAAYRAEE